MGAPPDMLSISSYQQRRVGCSVHCKHLDPHKLPYIAYLNHPARFTNQIQMNGGKLKRCCTHISPLLMNFSSNFSFQINMKGTYLPTREFLRRNLGRPLTVINTSSAGSTWTNPGLSSYQPGKTLIVCFIWCCTRRGLALNV
jgi:hypothetical protein